jgi:hypothetical protein
MPNVTRAFAAMLLTAVVLWPSPGAAQVVLPGPGRPPGRPIPPPQPEFTRFDLATYSFAATARSEVPAVVRVRLDSRELLHVALELHLTNQDATPDRTIRRVLRLSPAAFDDLLVDVQELSTAEIRTIISNIICQVIPSAQMRAGVLAVQRDYDPQTGAFLGAPAVIQSATGCWNPVQVTLMQPEDRAIASTFRAKLEILAAQVLRHQLVEVLR